MERAEQEELDVSGSGTRSFRLVLHGVHCTAIVSAGRGFGRRDSPLVCMKTSIEWQLSVIVGLDTRSAGRKKDFRRVNRFDGPPPCV